MPLVAIHKLEQMTFTKLVSASFNDSVKTVSVWPTSWLAANRFISGIGSFYLQRNSALEIALSICSSSLGKIQRSPVKVFKCSKFVESHLWVMVLESIDILSFYVHNFHFLSIGLNSRRSHFCEDHITKQFQSIFLPCIQNKLAKSTQLYNFS